MLRRCALVAVLAGVAVSLGLPLLLRAVWAAEVAGPGAVRLRAANGDRLSGQWQAWATASLVPTVAGQVTTPIETPTATPSPQPTPASTPRGRVA